MRHSLCFSLTILAAGCGSETGDIPRTRVEISVAASGTAQSLVTDAGWTVRLDAARLHVAGVRFFEGEPLFAQAGRALESLVVGRAEAHPGHYVPGESLADALSPATIDLLSATPVLLDGDGVSGRYESAQVDLAAGADLEGHTARIEGTATSGARSVRFDADLDLDQPVRGITAGFAVEADAAIALEVDLLIWVRRIDFGALPIETATITFSTDSQGHNAIQRGVQSTAAYVFRKEQ